MNQALFHLIRSLHSLSIASAEWKDICCEIIEELLKGRPICRDWHGVSLSSVHMDILDAARNKMRSRIHYDHAHNNLGRPTTAQWSQTVRKLAFQSAVTKENLHGLALQMQQYSPRTSVWSMALTELITALELSELMTKRSSLNRTISPPLTTDDYYELKNNVIIWVCEHIQKFPPENNPNCPFIAWVNERIKWMAIEFRQSTYDPAEKKANQSRTRKVRSFKASIKANLQRITLDDLHQWLELCFSQKFPDQELENILLILTVMHSLWQTLERTKTTEQIDDFLYAMVTEMVAAPMVVDKFGDRQSQDNPDYSNEHWQLNQVVYRPPISLEVIVRRCLENAPPQPFDKHIRNHPDATFRVIALARLNEVAWKTIATSFGIKNHTVISTFYYRFIDKYSPVIQDLFEQDLDFPST